MNRLQVGDECYVRGLISGVIYRCEYVGKVRGCDHVALPTKEGMEANFFDISKRSKTRLVYPFPCVKDLAI